MFVVKTTNSLDYGTSRLSLKTDDHKFNTQRHAYTPLETVSTKTVPEWRKIDTNHSVPYIFHRNVVKQWNT